MASQSKKIWATLGVVLCIAGLVVIAVVALLRSGPAEQAGEQLPKRFSYDIQALREIDPELIKYEEVLSIPIDMDATRAIAVGPPDLSGRSEEKLGQKIYVGGDRKILVFQLNSSKKADSPLKEGATAGLSSSESNQPQANTAEQASSGTPSSQIQLFQRVASYQLEFEPRALAVTPMKIFVAAKSRVAVLDNNGGLITTWPDRGERAVLTSITVDPAKNESGGFDVYVADAGNRVVLRYNSDGKLLNEINRLDSLDKIADDPKADRLGFVIPSPYFDVAMSEHGLLWVVNPGLHKIEAYTPEGLLEKPLSWGTTGYNIESFCGCCNPAAMAIFPDGRFVTGEKGLPRVKIYSAVGHFQCVVAGPKTLDPSAKNAEDTRDEHKLTAVDLAIDDKGRVLVLDPRAKAVRVFAKKVVDR